MAHTYDVVGIGSCPLDLLMLVDHFPQQEGVQEGQALQVEGGGPVATALVTLARLGARTAIVDVSGDDWRGQMVAASLRREGVATQHLRLLKGHEGALAMIFVRIADGARSISYVPSSAPDLRPEDVPKDLIQGARFLHLNGRHFKACLRACAFAREADVRISFDGGAHRFRPEFMDLVPLVDLCIVDREFAERYTQEVEVEAAAIRLLGEGPECVVITDGLRGSWVYSRAGTAFHQPALRMEKVVDTTGSGDAYHGGFLYGCLQGFDLRQSALLASGVAAMNTQAIGGRQALPTLQQVRTFLHLRGLSLSGGDE